jgi:hypothetical protein
MTTTNRAAETARLSSEIETWLDYGFLPVERVRRIERLARRLGIDLDEQIAAVRATLPA